MSSTPPTKSRYLTTQKIERLYKSFDTQKKGYIDHHDIINQAYQPYNHEEDPQSRGKKKKRKFRETYATELLKQCNQSVSGRITYQDFEKFVVDKERELWVEFVALDTSNDGELTIPEIATALERSGVKLNQHDLKEFVKHIDTDSNGAISFQEWAEFLMFLPRTANMTNIYAFYQNMVHQTDSLDPILLPDESDKAGPMVTFKYLIAGAAAGAFSRTCTAPLDRIRVLLQVETKKKSEIPKQGLQRIKWQLTKTWALCGQILYDGGVTAFWRGNGVNIIKIIPESAVRFYVFELAKKYLYDSRARPLQKEAGKLHVAKYEITTSERMVAGGVAGLASQSLIYPLDTIKTRMMAEMQSSFESGARKRITALGVARHMLLKDGYRSFFRGIVPSLIGIVPYASIDLTAYETLKTKYITYTGNKNPSPHIHLGCGAVAGALSCAIVYPLGLIRTRLQAQGSSTHKALYPGGTRDVILSTFRREGVLGFYKGLIPSLVKVVPAVSLSYICYEHVKKELHIK